MPIQRPSKQSVAFRAKIALLYLRGTSQPEIATALKLPLQAVSKELKAVRQEWVSEMPTDFNSAKATELAKINALEREYWNAWRRSIGSVTDESCSPKSVESAERRSKSAKAKSKRTNKRTETRTKLSTGDPRYLAGVQWCIKQRCVIFGVAEPQEPNQNGFTGPFDPSKYTLEQLERIIKGEDPAGVLEKQ